jgi:hypothetical protein
MRFLVAVETKDLPVPETEDIERRRAGRIESASPILIPLMRGDAFDSTPPDGEEETKRSDLDTATGIVISGIAGIGFWIIVFGIVRLIMRL